MKRVTSVYSVIGIVDVGGDRVDIGTLLHKGENTMTIRLHSTLYGRTYVEHSGYLDKGVEYSMGKGIMKPIDPNAYYNGLLSVKIVPYKESIIK